MFSLAKSSKWWQFLIAFWRKLLAFSKLASAKFDSSLSRTYLNRISPFFSFLLLFSSGHPINGGQTFIGNLLEPIVTFQELITTVFLHNFPILSFLLMFPSGHLNTSNGGQTFIGNLLQPIVTFQELITTEFLHNFPILSFLLLFPSGHPNNGGHSFIGNL